MLFSRCRAHTSVWGRGKRRWRVSLAEPRMERFVAALPWRVRHPRAGVHGENKAADDLAATCLLERTPASVCVVRVSSAWRLLKHGRDQRYLFGYTLSHLRYRRLKAQTIDSMLSSIWNCPWISVPFGIVLP